MWDVLSPTCHLYDMFMGPHGVRRKKPRHEATGIGKGQMIEGPHKSCSGLEFHLQLKTRKPVNSEQRSDMVFLCQRGGEVD